MNKGRFAFVLGLISFLGCASDSYAFSWSSWWQEKTWRPVISMGGGTSNSSNVGESQNFPIQDSITEEFYNYSASQTSQTTGLFDGFIGVEWSVNPNWLAQLGLDYSQTSHSAHGTFAQGADVPSEDNYSYFYNVASKQLLAEGKLLLVYQQRFHPYVLLGLGAAFNNAYGYATNVPPFLTFTRMYRANNTTAFSYAVGVGIDVDLAANLRFGIGYRFTDLGQVNLGSATIDGIGVTGSLSQSNLYSNQLLAQLTFVV